MTEELSELFAKLSHYRENRQTILGLKLKLTLTLLTDVRSSEFHFSDA